MGIGIVFLAVILPSCIMALPDGVPVRHHPDVCTSMSPGDHHPTNTATGPAPYTIVVSNTKYTTGQPIQVTVRANQSVTFAGFFVQARSQSDLAQTDAIGTFSKVPQGSHVLPCTSAAGAWSHSNDSPKTEITATWMPPSDNSGSLVFQATIVQDPASVYWEGVTSQVLSTAAPVSSSIFLLTVTMFWALIA